MFWSLVLPVKITFWLLLVIVIVVTFLAPKFKKRRSSIFVLSTLLAGITFLPLNYVILRTLDQYRFGIFSYPDHDSVNDFRVQRYLPEPATDITIEKTQHGYRAQFTISKPALENWNDARWKKVHGEQAAGEREKLESPNHVWPDFERTYGDLGWQKPVDATWYIGAGLRSDTNFKVWFSETAGVAYQCVGYW